VLFDAEFPRIVFLFAAVLALDDAECPTHKSSSRATLLLPIAIDVTLPTLRPALAETPIAMSAGVPPLDCATDVAPMTIAFEAFKIPP
jgi:hypothetical protein